jgi:predicted transcriptional regulator
MACLNTDGSITETARDLLKLASTVPLSAEDISGRTGQPLFRIRSNLRELSEAGLISEKNGIYTTTVLGRQKL